LRQISSSTKAPQEIGRELEDFIASFLKDLLPAEFRVETRCRVIDEQGNSSRVLDLAIVNSKFSVLFRSSDGSSLLMHESVEHVLELKRSLDSKSISDIFSKVNDWVNFKLKAEGNNPKDIFNIIKYNYASKFTAICVESKIELKTIQNKFLKESKKYKEVINSASIYILRVKENQNYKDKNKSPIGVFCWWGSYKDLMVNLTFDPLSDCIYEIYINISDKYVYNIIRKYFQWGTVWTINRINELLSQGPKIEN
jgi:hypothetical protein